MTIETVSEMPEFAKGVRLVFRELIDAVKNAEDGEVLKFVRDDEKILNATTLRKSIEQHTGKIVIVKRGDTHTAFIQVLSDAEKKQELINRVARAKEMKAKLKGKGN